MILATQINLIVMLGALALATAVACALLPQQRLVNNRQNVFVTN
jgi:hypothetical protein